MRRMLQAGAFPLLMLGALGIGAQGPVPLAELGKPGRLLMLRHAQAPGTGDPPGFALGDCATQRNLDAAGRGQARQLGERLRGAGITRAAIYSSQWCRCLETARLMDLGPVKELPALNSFYGRPGERKGNIDALRAFLARLPVASTPVILVTHQVTIGEFAGGGTPSGGGTIFELDGTPTPRVIGAIGTGDGW